MLGFDLLQEGQTFPLDPMANHNDQRRIYRVIPGKDLDLRVEATTANRGVLRGRVIDINLEGAAVAFAKADNPDLGVGKIIPIKILSEERQRSLRLEAQVMSRRDIDKTRRFGFKFVSEIEGHLTKELSQLFNQRRDVRVRPNPDEPVEVGVDTEEIGKDPEHPLNVSITGEEKQLDAKLWDVSAGGMRILVRNREVEHLKLGDSVSTFLWMPGKESRRIEMTAEVRYVASAGRGVFLGLAFKEAGTDDFVAKQKYIMEYVMARQREDIQRRANL